MLKNRLSATARRLANRPLRGLLLFTGVAVFTGMNVGSGCSFGNSGNISQIDVPMEYHPRSSEITMVHLANGSGVKILVSPTIDKRDEAEKRTIGKNTEDSSKPIPVYASGTSVADFVAKSVRAQVRNAGLSVTEDMANATRTLDTELTVFSVLESGNYQAQVSINFKVIDPTGKTLWEQAFSDDSHNFGKSKSPENYQETYSDALRGAVNKMLADPGFQAALVGKTADQ